MMRFLRNFLRFYSIYSEVLKTNVAGSGGTNIRFVPPHSEAGVHVPVSPGSDASVCCKCTVEAFNKIDNLLQLGINRVAAMSWVSPFLEHSVFIVKCDKPGYTRSF